MAASKTFLQSTGVVTGNNPVTFSAQNLGAASSDRIIVVGIAAHSTNATTDISSVTIAGVTATLSKVHRNTSSQNRITAVVAASVPTGTSGDIVVTYSAAAARTGIGVWRTTGMDITANDTAGSSANAPTASLTISSDGLGFGMAYTGEGTTTSWTNLTEEWDDQATFTTHTWSGASSSLSGTETRTATFASPLVSSGAFVAYPSASSPTNSGFLAFM